MWDRLTTGGRTGGERQSTDAAVGRLAPRHVHASIVDTRTLQMTSATLVQEPTRFAVVSDFLTRLGLPQDLLDLLQVRIMEAGL